MDTMTKKRGISSLRAELGIDQIVLANEARLAQSTISRLERGVPHGEQVMLRVFYAINRLRAQRGWPEIAFNDIDWPLKE